MEKINNMKKFVLTTASESGDEYIYFIEHKKLPTITQLKKWLKTNGTDIDDNKCYENIKECIEIVNFQKL
jgi:hypothetical protein